MLTSTKDVGRLVLRVAAIAVLGLGALPLFAQDPGSNVQAIPPIHTQGAPGPAIVGLTPDQIRHAYGFDQISNQGAGQTIGIIEAYDDPRIEFDLGVFSQ